MPRSVPRADRDGVAKRLESAPKPHLGRSLTRDKILVRRSTDPLRSLAMSCRRVAPTPPGGRPGLRGTRTGAARPRIVGGDDLALPVVAVAVELAGSHHPAEREASPQPIALRRPRLEAHEKSPGRRNREGAEKVREDHQGDKAPPARRPTRKRHNHSSNLWYDCASKRPNGTLFTFLGRFFAASLGLVKRPCTTQASGVLV